MEDRICMNGPFFKAEIAAGSSQRCKTKTGPLYIDRNSPD